MGLANGCDRKVGLIGNRPTCLNTWCFASFMSNWSRCCERASSSSEGLPVAADTQGCLGIWEAGCGCGSVREGHPRGHPSCGTRAQCAPPPRTHSTSSPRPRPGPAPARHREGPQGPWRSSISNPACLRHQKAPASSKGRVEEGEPGNGPNARLASDRVRSCRKLPQGEQEVKAFALVTAHAGLT